MVFITPLLSVKVGKYWSFVARWDKGMVFGGRKMCRMQVYWSCIWHCLKPQFLHFAVLISYSTISQRSNWSKGHDWECVYLYLSKITMSGLKFTEHNSWWAFSAQEFLHSSHLLQLYFEETSSGFCMMYIMRAKQFVLAHEQRAGCIVNLNRKAQLLPYLLFVCSHGWRSWMVRGSF